MTVEALRRRRPETLADLLDAYGRELQAVAYLILRDRARGRGRGHRDAPHGLRARWLDPRRAGAPGVAPPGRDQPGARVAAQDRPAHPPRPRPPTAPAGRPRRPNQLDPDGPPRGHRRPAAPDAGRRRPALLRRPRRSRRSRRPSARVPNTIKAQLQTALDRLRVHLADPVGPSLAGGPRCMTARFEELPPPDPSKRRGRHCLVHDYDRSAGTPARRATANDPATRLAGCHGGRGHRRGCHRRWRAAVAVAGRLPRRARRRRAPCRAARPPCPSRQRC